MNKFSISLSRSLACYVVSSVLLTVGTVGSAHAGMFSVPRPFQGTQTAIAYVGFSPTIVAVGAKRQQIESMHILDRPYRPFHFYGNTVRRRHYRQTSR